MAFSLDALNNIRANGSPDYQERIPVATRENFQAIGYAFQTYTVLFNEFTDKLFNKIGKTILEQKMFKNRLARFKSGEIFTQQDVEEIFIEISKAEGNYNPQGPNPLGRREGPDIQVAYHRQNRQDYYAISIGDIDFVRVFRSPETLDAFILGRLNSVYSGDQHDEFVMMKHLLGDFDGYDEYEVPTLDKAGNAKTFAVKFIKTLRKAVQDASFESTDHNKAGVLTKSEPSELVLLVNKDVLVECDVEQLATAFNQSNTDLKVVPSIVSMDDFGEMTDCYGLLVDKDFIRVWDTLSRMETQRNAQGLFTNYFYHHHQILSLSPFKTAIKFKAV